MKKKIILSILALYLVMFILPTKMVAVAATETFQYKISASTTAPYAGSEFDVEIMLTNYGSINDKIQGLQIDVTGIDESIFEVVSHESMIGDLTAASNKTTYSQAYKRVRLVYLSIAGNIDKSVSKVMKFRLKVKDDITADGMIELPVILKIGSVTETGKRNEAIILNDKITVNYTMEPAKTVNVDISWGNMEFVYDDGEWDTEKHKWKNRGWTPAAVGSNMISVSNKGNSDVKIMLSYSPETGYEKLDGTYTNSNGDTAQFPIKLNNETTNSYYLNLKGNVENRWTDDFIKIGKITVVITE